LEVASAITPGDAHLLLELAGVHGSRARLRGDEAARGRALDALRSATRLHPFDAGLQAALGSAHLSFGSTEAAADAFERALELDPYHRLYLVSLARVREDQGRLGDAADLYRRAISVESSSELRAHLRRVENP
jgi:tetratricopeptide (TPR) repeat protein